MNKNLADLPQLLLPLTKPSEHGKNAELILRDIPINSMQRLAAEVNILCTVSYNRLMLEDTKFETLQRSRKKLFRSYLNMPHSLRKSRNLGKVFLRGLELGTPPRNGEILIRLCVPCVLP